MLTADLSTSADFDRFLRALDEFPREVDKEMRSVSRLGAELVRGEVAEYPPATAANRSPGLNGYSWYERGFGTRTVTGRGYPTSEALGRSWTTEAKTTPGGWVGIAGTNASYAKVVQGEEQAAIHAARGWPRADKVLREKSGELVALVGKSVDKVLTWLERR